MGGQWQQFGRFNLVGLLGAGLQLLVYRLVMRRLDLPSRPGPSVYGDSTSATAWSRSQRMRSSPTFSWSGSVPPHSHLRLRP